MNKTMLKSIWAVVAGILTVFVLSVLTDAGLEAIGFPPPPDKGLFDTKLLLIALAYRTVYAFVGGYVTAKLAPRKPMKLVVILLIFGTLMGIMGVVVGWDLSDTWYPISLVFTSALGVWYGGTFATKKKKKK